MLMHRGYHPGLEPRPPPGELRVREGSAPETCLETTNFTAGSLHLSPEGCGTLGQGDHPGMAATKENHSGPEGCGTLGQGETLAWPPHKKLQRPGGLRDSCPPSMA